MGFEFEERQWKNNIPCLTSLDTAEAILRVLESINFFIRSNANKSNRKDVVLQEIKLENMKIVSQKVIATNIFELVLEGALSLAR